MDYLSWNNLIASHFFRPEMAGSIVHLYVTEEIIAELGELNNTDFPDFLESVKTGPTWVTRQGLCMKAQQSLIKWRQRKLDYPPYIGYLALFVLASGIEGDFANHSYYPRLRTLIGEEPNPGQYPSFDRMQELWEDLEQWLNEDKAGEWGLFNCVAVGKNHHIGLPLAQTLLTEEERRKLSLIFAAADLDPTAPLSEEAIASLLIKHGRKYLGNRTRKLLKETIATDELRQALLERIIDELHNWDGTAEVSASDGNQIYGFLRLCCQLDPIAQSATLTLRCSTKHEFPEEDLLLSLDDFKFSCSEQGMGWSSPLISESDQKIVDASEFDWCKGLRMRSVDSKWYFKLPAYPIRVFVKGDTQGLPGLVEVRQLPTQKPFYLAVHEDCLELLKKWGESSCKSFEWLPIINGLPNKWHFFKAAAAYSDELIKHEYPVLAFPTSVRLELSGGIRVDRSNKFFRFAPPKVVLQGGDESLKLYCNDRLLNCTNAEGIYELPTDIPSETRLAIEARIDDKIIKRRFLSLVDNFTSQYEMINQTFDCFGYRQTNFTPINEGVAGALVTGANFPEFNFNTFLPIQGKQRILFVGKEAGQISIWPLEPLPTDWMPVWAISKGRRRSQVMFCNSSLAESEPTISKCKDRKKLREWKEILWYDRKKIPPPAQANLRALWKKFQKEAERV